MPADKGDGGIGICGLDRFSSSQIHPERGRGSVQDHQVEGLGFVDGLLDRVSMWRGIQQTGPRYHPGRVCKPRGVPKRPNLAGSLIARTRPAVEVVIGRRVQEQGLHEIHDIGVSRWPVRVVSQALYKPAEPNARFPGKFEYFGRIPSLLLARLLKAPAQGCAHPCLSGKSVRANATAPVRPPIMVAANHKSPSAMASSRAIPA